MLNKTIITAIVDEEQVANVLAAITNLCTAVYVANTPYMLKAKVGEFNLIQGIGAFSNLGSLNKQNNAENAPISNFSNLVAQNGVDAAAKALAGNAYHTCVYNNANGKETRYLSAVGKPNKELTVDAVNEILAHGVHKVTFTKKDGNTVVYAATKDWAWCKENAEKIGYKEPKGTDGGKHAAQDAAKGLVTFFKVGMDASEGGYRRFAIDKLISIE